MKRLNPPPTCIFFIISLSNCPYETSIQTGSPIAIQSDISGTWQDPLNPKAVLHISNMNHSEILILGGESSKIEGVVFVARGFFSSIGSNTILNVQVLADEKGFRDSKKQTFYYAKIRKIPRRHFCYHLVGDELIKNKITNSAKLNQKLKQNWENTKLWEGKEVCMEAVL
jgi:hypothetical protein